MFGKKDKVTTYVEKDLYAVKYIVNLKNRMEEMYVSPMYKNGKDYAMMIEIANKTVDEINSFTKEHPELEDMFNLEKDIVDGLKKMCYLKLEEMEKPAE